MNSILDIQVSCFRNCTSPDDPQSVNLLSWLNSDKHADKVRQIRAINDKAQRGKIKKTLPAITPSGTFSRHEAAALISHSGFIGFDIDHVDDIDLVKQGISHIVNVAYCGLSVSGRGLWGLVPIRYPERHTEHFRALCNDFARYGYTLDKSCSNVDRLRIYSFDPDAYFNHEATPYIKLFTPPPAAVPRYERPADESVTRENVEKIISRITMDITANYGEEWFPIGAALANEFGESGRQYFHEISKHHPDYHPGETDRMFDHCLKGSYSQVTIASLFHIAKSYGVTYV